VNPIRQQLLELSKTQDINALGLRNTARLLGVKNPQTIKYHLQKLQEAGLITASIKFRHKVGKDILGSSDLITIPVLGSANAGPATHIADGRVQGFLRISSKLLASRNFKNLYALKITGSSMNQASIKGEPVEEGDYVVVDSDQINPKDGDYVIAVVDNLANIKKYNFDQANNRIVLQSESSDDYFPIIIHPDDETGRLINGKVIQVIKKPAFSA